MIELKGKHTANCKIFVHEIEDTALGLIQDILDNPAFEGAKIRIMPDTHAGKGIVIGFTCPLDKYVNPNHVGVDIGCTIDAWFTNVKASELDLVKLEKDIRDAVKFGKDLHETCQADTADFCRFVQEKIAMWHATWPEMIQPVTVDGLFVSAFCRRIGQQEETFWKSLGTVGSGNHFIEVGMEPKGGTLVFTIHCGSRNLGLKIANHHAKISAKRLPDQTFKEKTRALVAQYKAVGEQEKLPMVLDRLYEEYCNAIPEGYLTGEQMSDYLTDMAVGVAYALYNHELIARLVQDAFRKQVPSVTITDMVRSIHNYVDFTDHIIRKGAVRSYEGERLVIPFNMRDGLAICRGKSNHDWNCSAPHGAGRVMSRAEAKRTLSVEEFTHQMDGIVSTSVGAGTIDEAPGAYKSTELVMSLIQDTCDIDYLIKPLINLKDKNTADD